MNDAVTTTQKNARGRGIAAWVVLVIAALLFPLALTAFWAQKTVVDTARYVATVAPLAEDPTIQKAVADKISDVLITQIDAGNRLTTVLPDQLAPLAPMLAGGVNNFVTQQVDKFVTGPRFAQLWEDINRRAQQALIGSLSGNPTGSVAIQGDQIVLDTGDLIEEVKKQLVDRGLSWAANIPVPPIADRQVVLLTSPQLEAARTYYTIGQPVAAWLVWVVLLMFVVAIALSTRRPKMIIATGVAILLGAIALTIAMAFGQNELRNSFAGTPFALAEQAFWTILTQYLAIAVRMAFALGLVIAVIGWFLSGTGSAAATRGALSGGAAGMGARLANGPLAPLARFIAGLRRPLQFAVVVVAGIVLLVQDQLKASTILWTVVVAGLALFAIEVLAAAGRTDEIPEDSLEPAVETTTV